MQQALIYCTALREIILNSCMLSIYTINLKSIKSSKLGDCYGADSAIPLFSDANGKVNSDDNLIDLSF
jgi:hypothetical protein